MADQNPSSGAPGAEPWVRQFADEPEVQCVPCGERMPQALWPAHMAERHRMDLSALQADLADAPVVDETEDGRG